MENQINKPQHKSKAVTVLGMLFVALGISILINNISFLTVPHLAYSWPIMMIALGIYVGAKDNFKKNNWIYLTAIGVLFLLPNIISSFTFGMLWPLVMMAIGATIYSRRHQRWNGENWEKRNDDQFHKFDNNI